MNGIILNEKEVWEVCVWIFCFFEVFNLEYVMELVVVGLLFEVVF